MKVGVFVGSKNQKIGGGYTFETEIFQSLIECSSESHHQFTLLGVEREIPEIILQNKSIQYLSLHPSDSQGAKSKLIRGAKVLAKKLKNPFREIELQSEHEKFLLKAIKINNIDIIWYVGLYSELTISWLTAEVPYMTTVWDLQHRLQPHFPEVSIGGEWTRREEFLGRFVRRAAILLTGVEASKQEIEYFYQVPPERIKVLPHPTPSFALEVCSSPSEEVLHKYNLPENYLFYPAQFWSHKNHVNLLLAVKNLREQFGLEFPLVFVGSDQGNEAYVRQVTTELGLHQQVHFLGFVSREDLVQFYRHAFALTYASLFGPDNLPPLEAFALGCPVIASNVSGAEEQLGEAAILVDGKDPLHIASAIKTLWENPTLRQQLIERGYQRANQWTGKDYVRAVFSVLDEFEPIRRCWSCSQFPQSISLEVK